MTTNQPLKDLHAIAYARVSTDDHGQDTNIQLDAIRNWATSNGVIIDKEVSEDVSGAQWPRMGLSDALVSLRTSPATILICYDQSRLTRDAEHHLPLINELMGAGKTIRYVVTGADDPNSLGLRMLSAVKGVTDSEERRVLRDKTSKALCYKRDVLHQHVSRPATLVITDDLNKENYPTGLINTDPNKKTITKVLKPSEVLAYARCGYAFNKVARKFLNIHPSILIRAIDAYDEKHGEQLHKTYQEILKESKGVSN